MASKKNPTHLYEVISVQCLTHGNRPIRQRILEKRKDLDPDEMPKNQGLSYATCGEREAAVLNSYLTFHIRQTNSGIDLGLSQK